MIALTPCAITLGLALCGTLTGVSPAVSGTYSAMQSADVEAAIRAAQAVLWSGDAGRATLAFTEILHGLETEGQSAGVNAARARAGLATALCLQGDCATGPDVLRAARATLSARIGEDNVETLMVDAALADALRANGDHAAALVTARDSGDRADQVLGPDHPTTLWLRAGQAYALDELGREADAEAVLQRVIAGWVANGWTDTVQTRAGRIYRAYLLDQLDRPVEVVEILSDIVRLSDLAAEQQSAAWTTLNSALHKLGRFDEALEAARRAVEVTTAVYGPDHRESLRARANLAVILGEIGEAEESLALLRDSADRATARLGPRDRQTETAIYNLAAQLHTTGRPMEAVPLFRSLAELSPDFDVRRQAWQHLALTLSVLGLTADAIDAAERAVLLEEGPDSRGLLIALITLGQAYSQGQRNPEALSILERSLAMAARIDADWSTLSAAWLAMGEAQSATGDPVAAEASFRLAKTLADEHLSPGHPRRVYRDEQLAGTLTALARPQEALGLLRANAPLVTARMRSADTAAGFDAHGSDRALFSRLVEAAWSASLHATQAGTAR